MPVVTVTIAVKKLGRLLVSRQMNQAGLAREFGVTPAAVSYWMKGHLPALEMILRLVEWSDNYLTVEDFTKPYRRNVAIPDPPAPGVKIERAADPFVEAHRPPRRLMKIDITPYLDRQIVIAEGDQKLVFGENTLGMSAAALLINSPHPDDDAFALGFRTIPHHGRRR